MNEQDQRTEPSGRSVGVTAYGDTSDEIELDALDKAREFFGPEPRLRARHTYVAVSAESLDPKRTGGKKYFASIIVYVVENSDPS